MSYLYLQNHLRVKINNNNYENTMTKTNNDSDLNI